MSADDTMAATPYPPAPETLVDAGKVDPAVYEPAAQAGEMEAAYRLGLVYWGHDKRRIAEHWWQLAADQGHVEAMYRAGWAAALTSLLPGKAVKLLTRAAEAGSVDAMVALGEHFDRAVRKGHSQSDAQRWWQAAVDAGSPEAMVRMAEHAPGREEALPWLHRAAEAGSADALTHLGDDARDHGDLAGAIGWWQRAVAAGAKPPAVHAWAFSSDEVTALARAADGGDHDAETRLGELALDAHDFDLAHLVLDRAADAGQTTAMRRLAHLLEFHDGD